MRRAFLLGAFDGFALAAVASAPFLILCAFLAPPMTGPTVRGFVILSALMNAGFGLRISADVRRIEARRTPSPEHPVEQP